MSLYHQLAHMIRPARTTAPSVEDDTISQVQARHTAFEVKSMNSMQQVGIASALPLNTDVMAIHVGGDGSNGTIIASNHQQYRPKKLATGETILYDCQDKQQSILLKADGSIVITGAKKVLISCDTEVSITCPKVTVHGDLYVTGEIRAKSDSAPVTLSQHRHGLGPPPSAGTEKDGD